MNGERTNDYEQQINNKRKDQEKQKNERHQRWRNTERMKTEKNKEN